MNKHMTVGNKDGSLDPVHHLSINTKLAQLQKPSKTLPQKEGQYEHSL